ncbi:MAG: RNA polymerase sigma factor RpoD/SigA [Acidobacteriota bacterium]|jgi:RNA polymerase primary sigma factor
MSHQGGPTTVALYLNDIRRFRVLSRSEEAILASQIQEGERSVNDLVEANLNFVIQLAKEYRNPAVPFEDLLNEGNIGLVEAARRFDPDRGTKFITYAAWWIRKAILQAIAEQSTLVRVPLYTQRRLRQLQRDEEAREHGGAPGRTQPALGSGDLLRAQVHQVSLEDPVGKDREGRLEDLLPDLRARSPETDVERQDEIASLRSAVRGLSATERQVISDRFGLRGDSRTLQEIGQTLGLSRERVRQIERTAKLKLRRRLLAERHAPRKAPLASCVACA